ncbi:MAG: hypothetical protein KIY11_03310 [Thermoplasmata archaeon]|nr:hypothetical protein [Candidatus Sysuiplasma acidicola]
MKVLIHIHRRIAHDSDIPGLIASICARAETTIVLEGAAIFCMKRLTDDLHRLGAVFTLCVEDATEQLPLRRDAERIGRNGLSGLMAHANCLISF